MSVQNNKFDGLFIGVVKDNLDPDKLGRLKVVVPTYNDNTALDDIQWFYPCMPYGGYKDEGIFFIPSVGAEVIVTFIRGGETPIWLGCINKKVDNPGPKEATQEADDDHYVQRKIIKTRVGYIIWDDKDEYIMVKHNIGSFFSLTKEGDIDLRSERNINLKAGKSVNISAEKGDFCLESMYTAKLESKEGDFTIESVKGNIAMASLKENLYIIAGKNIQETSDENINLYANKNIKLTSATENISINSAKNTHIYAKKQIKAQSDQELSLSAKKNMVFSSEKDMYQYIIGNYKCGIGKTGLIKFGQSTDIIVSSGDLNVTVSSGKLKMHSGDNMVLDTKAQLSTYSKEDTTQYSDQVFNMSSKDNMNITVNKDLNMNVMKDYNSTALNTMNLSGKSAIYASSTNLVDIHGGQLIYTHTPMQLTEETGVMHYISGNTKNENTKLWITNSDTTIHNASSSYIIKAGIILLN